MQDKALNTQIGSTEFKGPVCKSNLPKDLENLMNKVLEHRKRSDFDLIARAYYFAEKAHEGQDRVDGSKYFTHPVAVANILAEMSNDAEMIAAGLLHDVLEENDKISREDLDREFGERVGFIVDGVTKIGRMTFTSYEKDRADNAFKMIFSTASDNRIIIVKLADRLHNMRTLSPLNAARQKRIAEETLFLFAPLAHRLGIYTIKNELENLAFQHQMPDEYQEIVRRLTINKVERQKVINEVLDKLSKNLANEGIKATVEGRIKSPYSIYKKMKSEKLEFDEIMDLIAIRIVVETRKDCYAALGITHSSYKHIHERIKDYIGSPKVNKYESLHTVIIGPQAEYIEVQIRTEEMHQIAEYGIAAHWLYKEGKEEISTADQFAAFFRQLVESRLDNEDPNDFLDMLERSLPPDNISVFTPQGDEILLPEGSTAVDFAYKIHTNVGNQCIGARVNGRVVPPEYVLNNGDIAFIMQQSNGEPSLDWLDFAITPYARTHIKRYFHKQKFEDLVSLGRRSLEKEEERLGLQGLGLTSRQQFRSWFKTFNKETSDEFFAAVGRGDINAKKALMTLKENRIKFLKQKHSKAKKITSIEKVPLEGKAHDLGIEVEGDENAKISLAQCCLPIHGDRIVGYVKQNKDITIHRMVCKKWKTRNLSQSQEVNVSWIKTSGNKYLSSIDVWALDRVGIIRDITMKIGETKVSVSDFKMQLAKDKTVRLRIRLQVKGKRDLERTIAAIQRIDDVLEVSRSVRMS